MCQLVKVSKIPWSCLRLEYKLKLEETLQLHHVMSAFKLLKMTGNKLY